MKSKQVREPIATWWKINDWRPEITPVRVVAFTDKFVTFLSKEWMFSGPDRFVERRESRDDIFPSFDEAKTVMIERANEAVECAKKSLQQKRSLLGQIESLKEPEMAA